MHEKASLVDSLQVCCMHHYAASIIETGTIYSHIIESTHLDGIYINSFTNCLYVLALCIIR